MLPIVTKISENMYNKPNLQPYKGIDTRHECPSCGTKKSFTLYLDGNTGEHIHRTVGICSRINKCGYHYPPKQFYLDNKDNTIYKVPTTATNRRIECKPILPAGEIPFEFLERSLNKSNNLIRFLSKIFTSEQLKKICKMYVLGSTIEKAVIFWQIDTNGKIRTGKVMQYNSTTGKRIKNTKNAIRWVHSDHKKDGTLDEKYNLQQCFFGEHLLPYNKDLPVAIVESEKTAIIASVLFPNFVWLAAGSIYGLSTEKCKVLAGRTVMLYPDLKAYSYWAKKALELQANIRCRIKISTVLEEIATPQEKEDGLDIADFICKQLKAIQENNSS